MPQEKIIVSLATATAQEVIAELGMQPHPEGGWYVQTFRDTAGGERGHSTAIYYLLTSGQRSHWHRVDADEIWHWYAGAALRLTLSQDGRERASHILGNSLGQNERPQIVVPKHHWQMAESLGDWSLVGCTVSPGFRFEGFELAPEGLLSFT